MDLEKKIRTIKSNDSFSDLSKEKYHRIRMESASEAKLKFQGDFVTLRLVRGKFKIMVWTAQFRVT